MKYRHIVFSIFLGWFIILNFLYGAITFIIVYLYKSSSINGTLFEYRDGISKLLWLKIFLIEYLDVLFTGIFYLIVSHVMLPCILFGVILVLFNTKTKFRNSMLISVGIAYFASIYLTALHLAIILWWIPFLLIQFILHITFLIGLIPFWKFKIDMKIGKFFVGLFRRLSFNHRLVKGGI